MKSSDKKRAVGYCRTSGEGQRDNTSIPRQKEAIQDFCFRNGWQFLHHYVDESRTGSTIAGRDEFQRMMKDAAVGQFDVIVPFDVSRFGRDGVDILGNAKFLRENLNVFVVDTKGGFDSRPDANVLANFMHAGISEWERRKIMERMIGGRIQRAREGKPWSGKKPFGRTYDKTTGKWTINERGRRMRELLERYADGEGLSALVKEFPEFTSNVLILNFVRTSQLSGTYVKEFDIPDLNIHGLKIPIPAIPEVISPKLFARVQARMKHRRTWNKEHRRHYVLTGFVRCGHCGTAMTGNCTNGRIYYRHCNYSKETQCVFHSIREEELVHPVLNYLFEFFTDEPTFNEALEQALPTDDQRKDAERDRDESRASLAKIEKQIGNLVNAIADGADAGLLISKQQDLLKSKASILERLGSLEERLVAMPNQEIFELQAETIRLQLLARVQNRDWSTLSHEEIRRFLIFLFGENPARTGHGITVTFEQKMWHIRFRGNVTFFHDVIDGRPIDHLFRRVAKYDNEKRKREFDAQMAAINKESAQANKSVNLTQQT